MKKEAQEKYVELQMLAQHIKNGQMQIEALEEQMHELLKTKQSIKEIMKGRKEGFMPIARGVFVKTKIESDQEILVNVGANVAVKKDIKESLDLVEKQIDEIRDYQQELLALVQEHNVNAKKIETELKELMK